MRDDDRGDARHESGNWSRQGLTLVGQRPLRTPGLGDLQQPRAAFKGHADALWGDVPATRVIER